MTKMPEKTYRYSSCFKASIVEEVRTGLSMLRPAGICLVGRDGVQPTGGEL